MHANTAALLRQSLSDDPAEFAEALARMFDGHDVIAESPEGQAFRAFTHLVGMPSQRAQLEADISEILARVRDLPAHLATVLSCFIDMMWQRVQEVEGVRKGAFRRISNFVRGGDALHYRSMRTRITEAQASAAEAFRTTHGSRDTGFTVPMSGVVTRSVGRLRLDSGNASLPDPVTDSSGEFTINLAALAGKESIDWAALRAAVNEALEAHGGFATLPEVLTRLREPRTGDIIGIGCGSFEVSWLGCEDVVVAVFCVVDAFVLAAQVEAPVVLQVAVGDEGAEPEDGFGAFQAPSCARYVHSVLN
jgi:hypothetical protein